MPKILLIENDITRKSIISDILTGCGMTVVTAPDGKSGMAEFERTAPDLVISDIHLPDISGFTIPGSLRKRIGSSYVPVLLIAHGKEFTLFRKALAAGADDLVQFPLSSSDFLSSVNSLLNKGAARKRHRFPAPVKYKEQNLSPLIGPSGESGNNEKRMKSEDHIIINSGGYSRVVKIGALKCITALGDYSAVVTGDNKFLVRKTMKEWLEILPSGAFIRIHRSTIINLAFVERIEKMLNRGYKVYIQNIAKPFITSRRFSSGIRSKFI